MLRINLRSSFQLAHIVFLPFFMLPSCMSPNPELGSRPSGAESWETQRDLSPAMPGLEASLPSSLAADLLSTVVPQPTHPERGRRDDEAIEADSEHQGNLDIQARISIESWRFAELEEEEINFEDLDREAIRLDFRIGTREIALAPFVAFERTAEATAEGGVLDELEGTAYGLGLEGQPILVGSDEGGFFVDYGARGGWHRGTRDLLVSIPGLSVPLFTEQEVTYWEFVGRLGPGYEHRGLRVSAGAIVSVVDGEIEYEDFDLTTDLEAENVGGFVGFGYGPDDSPILASVEAYWGDIQGFLVSVGFRF